MVWYGNVWYSLVGNGRVWSGMIWYDMVWYDILYDIYGVVSCNVAVTSGLNKESFASSGV